MNFRIKLASVTIVLIILTAFSLQIRAAQPVLNGLTTDVDQASSRNLYTSITGDDMMDILREMGFTPELTKDPDGDPLIRFQIDGVKTAIYLYKGQDGSYQSIQFFVGVDNKASLEKINEWNTKFRFGRVYSNANGALRMECDATLRGGVDKENLMELVRRWKRLLGDFKHFFAI